MTLLILWSVHLIMQSVSLVLEMEEQMVNDQLYDHASLGGGILALEHHLLDVSSVNNLVQGIFYIIAIQVGHNVFIRYKKMEKPLIH